MIFVCSRCKKEYGEEEAKWRCDCGGYLSCKREVSFKKEDIRPERFNMWRYDAAYPLKYEELAVTYQEGMTPLAECPKAPCRLRIKMDQLMPTGSFKDRGTVMVVNYLLKRGAKRIVEDSSGNAGASVAGYCALGGGGFGGTAIPGRICRP
ncbi:MAG TPA: pyridoxal-phosphate dependent enzyme [Candidatus Enterocloster excrementipullorum]|uniref:Pyridoxal-phosphate dependent enzyme n=1 Tax=Candidatus Enterocloster excrementipullorum TaxID=2838559 RepID=A0A9D2N1S4_9FIRM|nr:pyridoxal-phosphate dependent enzyme [Candidatus Enterocloster excrementipullorum]